MKPAKFLFVFFVSSIYFSISHSGIFPEHSFSDEARGATSANFLKTPASARFEAMGGAGLALKTPDSFFYNPAGLAFLRKKSSVLILNYETMLETSGRTSMAYIKASEPWVLGAGFLFYSSADFEELSAGGVKTGDFSVYDLSAIFSFSRRFGFADFGAAVKLLRSKLHTETGNSAACDFGIIFKDREGFGPSADLAVAVRNLGFPMKSGSESFPLPFELAGGLNWHYTRNMDLIVEGKLPVDHAPFVAAGAELFVPFSRKVSGNGVFLRTGYSFKNHRDLGFMGGFSAGFGAKLNSIGIDYAFVPYGDLGSTHRATLSYGFGDISAERPDSPARKPDLRTDKFLKRLAVAGIEAKHGTRDAEAIMAENFIESELIKSGAYKVLERTSMEMILAEKNRAESKSYGVEYAVGLGTFVLADEMVFGTLSKIDNKFQLSVKIVEVGTGEIIASESETAKTAYDLKQAVKILVKRMLSE
ncbi:MAG: hypothetical protein HY746_00785 [Elusimicrobia bacterium]|nr:hypothetical protein [Elusimicrobiota bacterium]